MGGHSGIVGLLHAILNLIYVSCSMGLKG